MTFVTIIIILIAFVSLVFLFIRHRFTFWSRRGVRGPSFLELLLRAKEEHHKICMDLERKYGKIYGFYGLLDNHIVVNEPDLIRDIMVKDFHVFPDRVHIHFGSDRVSLGLSFLPGDERWRRIRSIISPAFTSYKLKLMLDSMSDLADKFVDNISITAQNGEAFDIKKYISAFVIDVISSCAYGINADTINNPNHSFVTNVKKLFGVDASLSVVLSLVTPSVAKFLKLEVLDSSATQFFASLTKKIVEERKKKVNVKNKKRHDFIQLMIDANEKDHESNVDLIEESFKFGDEANENKDSIQTNSTNKSLTLDELTAQGLLFFIAGYDTTSASLSHTIYYLSQNPLCQEKLYQELSTLTEFTHESLTRLKYLNAVILESLRMAPALLMIPRTSVKDYVLGDTGILIPAGTTIHFLSYCLHHDPNNFEDPEDFKPERFITDSGKPKHHPYAFIPFGGGPRNCIGSRFAMTQMRMCVAKLIFNFKFRLAPDFKIDYHTGNIIFSPKEVMVIADKRT